jgi:hypothetical protein
MSDARSARAVNEWLSASAPSEDVLELMCECGQASCRRFFQLTASRYGKIRDQRDRLLLVPEHLDETAFEVIRRWPDVILVRAR